MPKKRKKKKIAVRRTWAFHPATRVAKDKSKYNRPKAKRELLSEMQ